MEEEIAEDAGGGRQGERYGIRERDREGLVGEMEGGNDGWG